MRNYLDSQDEVLLGHLFYRSSVLLKRLVPQNENDSPMSWKRPHITLSSGTPIRGNPTLFAQWSDTRWRDVGSTRTLPFFWSSQTSPLIEPTLRYMWILLEDWGDFDIRSALQKWEYPSIDVDDSKRLISKKRLKRVKTWYFQTTHPAASKVPDQKKLWRS